MKLFAPNVASARIPLAWPKFTFQAAVLIAATLTTGSARLTAQQPYGYPAQPPVTDGYGQYAAPTNRSIQRRKIAVTL